MDDEDLVLGGTGLSGSKTVAILRQGSHEVFAASPKSGINSITGEGLKEAVTGAQVVIDPYTIIRSTQFLGFLGSIAASSADGNVLRLSPG